MLDEALGEGLEDEPGTDAMRIEAVRTVAVRTDALRALELFTDAEAIELTGIVALKL